MGSIYLLRKTLEILAPLTVMCCNISLPIKSSVQNQVASNFSSQIFISTISLFLLMKTSLFSPSLFLIVTFCTFSPLTNLTVLWSMFPQISNLSSHLLTSTISLLVSQ